VDRLPGDTRVNITNQGHSFIALVVAFLLVSRVRIALNRYNHVRACLGTLYRETTELVQNACVLSETPKNTSSPDAQQWRHELAYRALILLRTCMAVIDYPVTRTPAWAVPELNGNEMIDVEQNTFVHRYAHTSRAESEESLRVPIRLAYLLRKTLNSHKKRLVDPLPVAHVGKIMANIDTTMNGYYGVRQFMTTPVPFPLIQMARTFLFLYVFTVPFVLIGDESSLLSHCFMVFVMTYGFVGLELVAIEMDNPFGDDANDFDNK
jgi:predicted membrane chloride channel (bestrophin family)